MRPRFLIIPFVLVLSVLIIAGCNPNPQPAGLTPIPSIGPGATATLLPVSPPTGPAQETVAPGVETGPQAGVAAAGPYVFEQNCATCHGNQAQGGHGPALRNSSYIQSAGDQAIFTTVAGGRPGTGMPAWLIDNGGPLDAARINNVIAYLHLLQNVPPLPKPTEMPPEPTETPLPPNVTEVPAAPAVPSNPGGPGPAASLAGDAKRGMPLFGQFCAACHGPEGIQGFPNPGSEDGSVPPLNPIDPTIADKDPKKFATNVDLFVEHGSVPDGENPQIVMPAFGDRKLLNDQQLADIIAYVISVNSGK